jgi:UDP-N-acetylmuramoyl-tripeptide--D-alanyl-D-alanine ligase
MKPLKASVTVILNWAVASFIKRNRIKVIAVAGSIGKTSTSSAIRTVLSQKYRVHQPTTAYNTAKSVHLELFDMQFATSAIGWATSVVTVLFRSFGKAAYEYIVVEIGTDHPGELKGFAWLKPELTVLTAITPEHMEYFGTIEAVAEEELSVAGFSQKILCNANTVDKKFITSDLNDLVEWYGPGTAYNMGHYRMKPGDVSADFIADSTKLTHVKLQVLGEHSLDALVAAMMVGHMYGLDAAELQSGLSAIGPVKGRMQSLSGIDGSFIIDDSYNSSPNATISALDVLYQFETVQRIAVLGMMNEMGDYSEQAHTQVGAYCNPAKLDFVATVGKDANQYLAQAAEQAGCTVYRFTSPYELGAFVKDRLKPGAVILYKGSQNGVFVEESIKSVLKDNSDRSKLVRQSDFWLRQKAQQFKDMAV